MNKNRINIPFFKEIVLIYISLFFIQETCYALSSKLKRNYSKIKNYCVYYGNFNHQKIKTAHEFDLIIIHPGKYGKNLSPKIVDAIKKGKDKKLNTQDDVLTLAYLSIGEDETIDRNARVTKEGFMGPTYVSSSGNRISQHNGYRDWYLDHQAYVTDSSKNKLWLDSGLAKSTLGSDGVPDENGKWHSYYVDVANPSWQQKLKSKATQYLRHLKVDGLFLDTIDTASPWGLYPWMKDDMFQCIKFLRTLFPQPIILINRGLFLFDDYGIELSQLVNGVMFESYVTEWDWYRKKAEPNPWYASNEIIYRKKLLPLSLKSRTFKIFMLDYLNNEQKEYPSFLLSHHLDTNHRNTLHYFSSPDLHHFFLPTELKKYSIETLTNITTSSHNGYLSVITNQNFPKNSFLVRLKTKQNKFVQYPFEPYTHDDNFNLRLYGVMNGSYLLDITTLHNNKIYTNQYKVEIEFSNSLLAPVSNIKRTAYDQAIKLSWEKVNNATYYLIHLSSKQDKRVIRSEKENIRITNLINTQPYQFQIQAMNSSGRGTLTRPYFITPIDCTPPERPSITHLSQKDHTIFMRFKPKLRSDVAGYYLYIDHKTQHQKDSIPIKIAAYTNNHTFKLPLKGLYTIALSCFDSSNNESKRSKPHTLFIQ